MLKTAKKTIVITGSNKGIGYAILERLLKDHLSYQFIMGVRSIDNGKQALEKLSGSIPEVASRVQVEQLDISNPESVDKFVSRMGKIDALINNAGIASKGDAFDSDIVKATFQTNYYGTMNLTEKMIPLINDNGKIINIESTSGKLNKMTDERLIETYSDPNVTQEQIDTLAKQFYEAVVDDTYAQKGFPRNAYAMSKICLNLYTMRVLSKKEDILKRNIQVYLVNPGWCRTDMAGPKAPKSAEEGAETPVYLMNLPWEINKEYQGQFFNECKIISIKE